MKIEVGKTYRTHSGLKVKIHAYQKNADYEYVGYVWGVKWVQYTEDGRSNEDDHSITLEWAEMPEKKRRCNRV